MEKEEIMTPQCKNPDHPGPRNTMQCAEEPTEDRPFYVFWCPVCADALKVKSIQVFTASRFKREVRENLAAEGRLQTRPPAKIRRTRFNDELRQKRGLK